MKRRKFVKHLKEHGCQLVRHGGKHDVYQNELTGKKATLPRHRALDDLLCNEICKQLGIEKVK